MENYETLAQNIADFLRSPAVNSQKTGIMLLQSQTLGWGKSKFNQFLQRVIYNYMSNSEFKNGFIFSKIKNQLQENFAWVINYRKYDIESIGLNPKKTFRTTFDLGGYFKFTLWFCTKSIPSTKWYLKIDSKKLRDKPKRQWYLDCFFAHFFRPENLSLYITYYHSASGLEQTKAYGFLDNDADIDAVLQEVAHKAANHLQRNIFAEL